MPEEYGLLLGIAVRQWGNGQKRGCWGRRSHVGDILGGKEGENIGWGNEKENGERSKHCKEAGVLYKVSFHAELLLSMCNQGRFQMEGRGRAAGVYAGGDPGGPAGRGWCESGFVFVHLPVLVLSLFSWSFYIRKKVSINFCSFFAFGARLPGF